MLGYTIPVYISVGIWLSVFYFLYSMFGIVWKIVYFILAVSIVYLMISGASTVAIGIYMGLMTIPIWYSGVFG